MDELTVTTIARGLGRLLRLWAESEPPDSGWRLLLLLHGEDDVDRIRTEVPCAAYFLPWLSPGSGVQKPLKIEPRRSLLKRELQTLSDVLSPTPV